MQDQLAKYSRLFVVDDAQTKLKQALAVLEPALDTVFPVDAQDILFRTRTLLSDKTIAEFKTFVFGNTSMSPTDKKSLAEELALLTSCNIGKQFKCPYDANEMEVVEAIHGKNKCGKLFNYRKAYLDHVENMHEE